MLRIVFVKNKQEIDGVYKLVTLPSLLKNMVFIYVQYQPLSSICSWNSGIYLQENFSITEKISIQFKLFPNFHNKIVHYFFHHFCQTAVKSGRELATATLTTYLPYLPYLTYLPYLPSLPYLPFLNTLPTLPTLPTLLTLPTLPTFQICLEHRQPRSNPLPCGDAWFLWIYFYDISSIK